jgi:muramoyltetrapeptide carboxypeptidase
MLRPPALRPGDPVSIVAPSSPFDRASFERGLELLASRYRPVFAPGIFSKERYLAGSDERRQAELAEALASSETRAVFCARGGYGAMRLLRGLGLPAVAKPLVGFSDVTALHCALQAAGRVSVHGPVVTQLGAQGSRAAEPLFALLESPLPPPALRGSPVVRGVAEGPVVGGNLSVLTRLLGTPYLPPFDGAILFVEDVTERPYRLDRMWQHLELAGVLGRVAGIALGSFTGCDDAELNGEQVVRELAEATGLPCVAGLPVGHGDENLPLPLGARARLDGEAGTLEFLEGAVA